MITLTKNNIKSEYYGISTENWINPRDIIFKYDVNVYLEWPIFEIIQIQIKNRIIGSISRSFK